MSLNVFRKCFKMFKKSVKLYDQFWNFPNEKILIFKIEELLISFEVCNQLNIATLRCYKHSVKQNISVWYNLGQFLLLMRWFEFKIVHLSLFERSKFILLSNYKVWHKDKKLFDLILIQITQTKTTCIGLFYFLVENSNEIFFIFSVYQIHSIVILKSLFFIQSTVDSKDLKFIKKVV